MMKYIPSEIEKKWQEKWRKEKTFSPNLDTAKKPFYSLMMFPYPSAEGLHVGNMYAFTGSDIFSRLKRLQGFDVFEPMGLDGFGIHSENYAMKVNKHPMDLSKVSEERFYKQLESIGNAFDWERTVETYKPEYYRWTQWIFLQMFKQKLAYKKKAEVNWCPSCKTVLADEQVISGKCERCSSEVGKKMLEQWFFRITDYADRLLKNLDGLDWSEKVKTAQRNWIGKSEGMIIDFGGIEVFTTKPETIDGATFLVLAPEHEKVAKLTTQEQSTQVKEYIEMAKKRSEFERSNLKEKTGVFTGSYAENPVTKKQIPVWIADYVLVGYGTGAIMAVPDGDDRDREFAEKFKLPIESTSYEAKPEGVKRVNYHLRDWLISRQRYWGPPIPMIYCDSCGTVPVPEKDLPVVLPYVENFRPTGTGVSPLASNEEFYKVNCPTCGKEARRETDVSDTFLDSAWYFLRYLSTDETKQPWSSERLKNWMPVNTYIGGAEHSVLHLLYSRFLSMVFKDMGLISHFEEPFTQFRAHGLIISEGAKMSKSKGNVINPDDFIRDYGADTLRVYLMFLGPYDQGGDFREQAIVGPYNFLKRIWDLQKKVDGSTQEGLGNEDKLWLNKTLKKVVDDVLELKFNTAIASLMEWLNFLSKKEKIAVSEYKLLLILLAPFAPHITEEIWEILGEKLSIHFQMLPSVDENSMVQKYLRIPIQVNGKVRAVLQVSNSELEKDKIVKKALLEGSVTRHIEGKAYEIIYLEGKVLNFVLSS
ncbi:MAG: class I tRNA ligase family protein [Microgenomates group bacterium]